jgi:hypothetical protein
MRQLASSLVMPIFLVDMAGTLLFYNEPAEQILGTRFDETGEMPASEWTTRWEPSDAEGAPLAPERLPLMVAVQEDRPALGDHLRELPNVTLHEVPSEPFQVGEFRVLADRICHPGITVGYRIEGEGGTLAYLPDHEPALGVSHFPLSAEWTSGYLLARGADLLVHDAQYSLAEYAAHVGWGHSALDHTLAFARLADVRHLVTFHHDPAHSDDDIDRLTAEATALARPSFEVTSGAEGDVFAVGAA